MLCLCVVLRVVGCLVFSCSVQDFGNSDNKPPRFSFEAKLDGQMSMDEEPSHLGSAISSNKRESLFGCHGGGKRDTMAFGKDPIEAEPGSQTREERASTNRYVLRRHEETPAGAWIRIHSHFRIIRTPTILSALNLFAIGVVKS